MTRALWFFVLLTAFFVVAVRCVGVLSGAAAVEGCAAVALSQGCNAPADSGTSTTGATLEDDSDDGCDALLAPSRALLALVVVPELEGNRAAAVVQQRASQSHGRGLDRPPRA